MKELKDITLNKKFINAIDLKALKKLDSKQLKKLSKILDKIK